MTMASVAVTFLLLYFAMNKFIIINGSNQRQNESVPVAYDMMEKILNESCSNSAVQNWLKDSSIFASLFEPLAISSQNIGYSLFTNNNPSDGVSLKISEMSSLSKANFTLNVPLKMIIHGWADSESSTWIDRMKRNYLKRGDFNVVVIDWSIVSFRDFLTSSRAIKLVSKYVSEFVKHFLDEGILEEANIHILGHSLGAHIAGLIGDNFRGRIGRITGMDPARPDFEAPILKDPKDRLDSTDAKFVDVIHTDAGAAGFVKPLGHIDFYPNGGSFRQPGCPIFMSHMCSHGRSREYMTESIINPEAFPALKCKNWKDFKLNRCKKSRLTYMGEYTDQRARGIYFLETNLQPPFGRGEV